MTVVEQAVKDGGGHDRIAKDLAPFAHGAVGGDQGISELIAPTDQLDENMGGIRLDGQVAQFVDDQEFRLHEVQQLVLEVPLGMRLPQLRDERRGAGKEHGVPGGDRRAVEPDA